MVLDTHPYRVAMREYRVLHDLADEPGFDETLHVPLGAAGTRLLKREQTHMHARGVLNAHWVTGKLNPATRKILIPPPDPNRAPQHAGGYSACTNATFAGCDQGVDFTGIGKVYALADCVITRVDFNTGWPGTHGTGTGTVIAYRMTSGPRSGQFVYIAEAIGPVKGLKVGDTLVKGQLVGMLNSNYPGIETGFAQNAHGDAFGTTQDGKPGGPDPVHGRAMADFIKQLST